MTVIINLIDEGTKRFVNTKYLRITKDCVHVRNVEYDPYLDKFVYHKRIYNRRNITNLFCDMVNDA